MGLLLGNAAVLTALLVYFGWRRNDAHADGLGVQENILDQSTQDYVLRSVGPVVVLLLVVLALGFLGITLNKWLTPRLVNALRKARSSEPGEEPGKREWTGRISGLIRLLIPRVVLWALAMSWLVVPVAAIVAFLLRPELDVLVPTAVAVGALLTAKAVQVRHAVNSDAVNRSDIQPTTLTARMLIGGLVVLCMFWATDLYAASEGRRLAAELTGSIPSLTEVVVYSPEQLHITEAGTQEIPLPGDNSAYRFRYTGLRLLTRAGDRYYLISDCWTRDRGTIITLRAADAYRFEFVHDGRPNRPRAVCPAP